MQITDADRAAASALRDSLADISGFWFKAGDDSALCLALAKHRLEAERRLVAKLQPMASVAAAPRDAVDFGRKALRLPRGLPLLGAEGLKEQSADL